ncbi:MAG: DNA-directed RNA polymerase specialized sigma24 family protein [Planctomycetota bacterium]|jgi:DNA-directed RNA polymerase specialized sigma24 family protein
MQPDPNETCWTVLRAAAGGDRGARSEFARSYANIIKVYLRHRWSGNPLLGDVDDAAQEAFVEAFKPNGFIERADPAQGDFRGLLYGVVRNVARRFEQHAANASERHADETVYLDGLPHDALALSKVFDRSWAQSLMREAVDHHEQASSTDAVAKRRFRVLSMRHNDVMPIREIAAALGELDVAMIHNDYRQARRAFTAHLRLVVARHTGVIESEIDEECKRLFDLLG